MTEPVISSALPDVINNYITLRAERLLADKAAESLKEKETVLFRQIIAEYRERGIEVLGGNLGVVKMHKKVKPIVTTPEDWRLVYSFIEQEQRFDLLHKRLTESAVEELWENGIEVPGVGRNDVYTLSVSGAK
jgi:hypothetical protein